MVARAVEEGGGGGGSGWEPQGLQPVIISALKCTTLLKINKCRTQPLNLT